MQALYLSALCLNKALRNCQQQQERRVVRQLRGHLPVTTTTTTTVHALGLAFERRPGMPIMTMAEDEEKEMVNFESSGLILPFTRAIEKSSGLL